MADFQGFIKNLKLKVKDDAPTYELVLAIPRLGSYDLNHLAQLTGEKVQIRVEPVTEQITFVHVPQPAEDVTEDATEETPDDTSTEDYPIVEEVGD